MATYKAAGAIGKFISQSDGIVYMLNANTWFATPPLAYVPAAAKIADLQVAETLARTGVTGSAAARDIVFNEVLMNMRNYQSFVQNLADAAGNRTLSIAIISASGFGLKVDGVTIKAPLSVQLNGASGGVTLNSKAAQSKALYNWQVGYLVFPGPDIAWTDLPSSMKSKVVVHSLPLNVRTFFRNRILTKNGLSG